MRVCSCESQLRDGGTRFTYFTVQLKRRCNLYLTRLPANWSISSGHEHDDFVISSISRNHDIVGGHDTATCCNVLNCLLRVFSDIDECAAGQVCREADEMCQNTRGSFRCNRINCPSGYHRDPMRKK